MRYSFLARVPWSKCHLPFKQGGGALLVLLCCCFLAALIECPLAQSPSSYGPWDATEDLNEQHKALLRFILSGNTAFWSRPAVAYRIGFGTAPWRCILRCEGQFYRSGRECAPDCITQTYCWADASALSDPTIACCALNLLDQSYQHYAPRFYTAPNWCGLYPPWGSNVRPSVCDFNTYNARGVKPSLGAGDPFLAVSCSRRTTTTFYITGSLYRNDTATRIMYDRDIQQTSVTRNSVTRISLRHMAAWHHPSINMSGPPSFSLVDDLVCLPLEEIYFEDVLFRSEHTGLAVLPDRRGANGATFNLWDYTTWTCNNTLNNGYRFRKESWDLRKDQIGSLTFQSYFMMIFDPCGVGRALVRRNVTSLNPRLGLRNTAMEKCLFTPFTELNAMRWSGRARLEWSNDLQEALVSIQYGNQSFPRGWVPQVPDPVAARPFLPDTLKRLTIKRTNDGSHPSKTWRGRPVIKGFLPSEWALLEKLEYLDLSDDMGQGLIEGPIPSTWLMMTKLRTINLTGQPNFCKDWHRIVSYQMYMHCSLALATQYGQNGTLGWLGLDLTHYLCRPWRGYYTWSVLVKGRPLTLFDLDGHGWQWFDEKTGEAGYTNVIAPDGKCCWDVYSDQLLTKPSAVIPRLQALRSDYGWRHILGAYQDFCERAPLFPFQSKATGLRPPIPPVAPKPPDLPGVPPIPPKRLGGNGDIPPRPPWFPQIPGVSPLRSSVPPQPQRPPSLPGKWAGAWSWHPPLPPRPPYAPIDCSLAESQVNITTPAVARGDFYILLLSPADASTVYCKICACNTMYSVLERGASALYNSTLPSTAKLTTLASSVTSSSNHGAVNSADMAGGYEIPMRGRLDSSNEAGIPSQSQWRLVKAGSSSPLLTLEELINLGAKMTGQGVIQEVNITDIQSSITINNRGSIAKAWKVEPALEGDYLFRIQAGRSVWYRWVIVEMEPPHISGQLFMSNNLLTPVNPLVASKNEKSTPMRYLYLSLGMSKPVQIFDIALTMELSGGATLLNFKCFESADMAASQATEMEPVTFMAFMDFPERIVKQPLPGPLSVTGGKGVDYASLSGLPYARSCLAKLYAVEGSQPCVTLPNGSVTDLLGNPTIQSFSLQAKLPEASSRFTYSIGLAGTILASTSFFSALVFRLMVLQNMYHIQMLALSANLASPGVSCGYREVARYLRWSVMSIKGNIPILDRAFSKLTEIRLPDSFDSKLGTDLSSADTISDNLGPILAPPWPVPPVATPSAAALPQGPHPAQQSQYRPLSASQDWQTQPSLQATQLLDPPLLEQGIARPSIPRDLNPGRKVPEVIHPRTGGEMDISDTSNRKFSSNNESSMGISRSREVISYMRTSSSGGTAADKSAGAKADLDGCRLDNCTVGNSSPLTTLPQASDGLPRTFTIMVDVQDLLYTFTAAVLLMCILLTGHALFNWLYRRFINDDIPLSLQFPCVEMSLGGLLLVSITFYSFFALGLPAEQRKHSAASRALAAVALSLIIIPYLGFLWWLTVCRWYLEEKSESSDQSNPRPSCYLNLEPIEGHASDAYPLPPDPSSLKPPGGGAAHTSKVVNSGHGRNKSSIAGREAGRGLQGPVGEATETSRYVSKIPIVASDVTLIHSTEPSSQDARGVSSQQATVTYYNGLAGVEVTSLDGSLTRSQNSARHQLQTPNLEHMSEHMTQTSRERDDVSDPHALSSRKLLFSQYPGKQLPICNLDYRPGCWPRSLRIAPPIGFLARFEFLFLSAIGEGHQQKGRETKFILSSIPINMTHKVLCAATLGGFGMHTHNNILQLALLTIIQTAMLAYLVVCHPFVKWRRQTEELVAHTLEMVLIICACALLNSKPGNSAPISYLMIVCFFFIVVVVTVYDIWSTIKAARELFNQRRKRVDKNELHGNESGSDFQGDDFYDSQAAEEMKRITS